MDRRTTVQKRKRADTTEDTISMQSLSESLNSDDYRYGLPSIEEDNSDDSDVDQPDNESLHQSTLFWSTQRTLSADQEDKLSLGIPPVGHQMKGVPGSFLHIVSIN